MMTATETTPTLLHGCDTVVKLWRQQCLERGERIAHREKDLGIWQSYSWRDYYEHARAIGVALLSMGLERGQPVSILSEDNKEWLYCDLGIAGAGGISNGVYTTDSAEQLAYLVNDSGSAFLFVENDEQLDKYMTVRDQVPTLKKVIVFDRKGLRDFQDPMVMFLDELYELGNGIADAEQQFSASIEQSRPDDIRMLIYTSGTTGAPKGAMISHQNVLFQMAAGEALLEARQEDDQLCFLPLCHILERLVSVEVPIYKGCTVNFAESPETVFENLREVSPHTFAAVPRLWEKIYSSLMTLRDEATGFGRWCFDHALAAGRAWHCEKQRSPLNAVRYQFWNLLVLRNVRDLIGMSRLRRGTTGAAPISPDQIRWFRALGVPLYEGYGMTETTGVVSLNSREREQVGSVGEPLPETQVRIADNGEVLVRGGHVFAGYWRKPEKTAEDIRDGWLHTGDVGRLEDGMLTITGRLKDIIITAGGKNITPAEIESRLKFSSYISDAVVIGDKRKYLTCLIMIDQENVEKYAQDRQVPFSNFASLCRAKEVVDLIDGIIKDVNKQFAQVEQIKYFRLIDVLLTAEDEELTATMKLKRSFVEKKHKHLIDSMY
ncbi:MAG: long-chain fatty acid--CoA ligase [Pseudomonadota bacterium]|jgi:long-chain acyl-CoA synthetase|uniref:AMP-dependent synthetase/ligase n=1 Tax=Alloalcanivorax venustensis TaxID=172371 RepID=UPI002EA99FFA|nr:long-chain fatty acid--CoA ligase [Pseudomonadota bacterium]|tara:strand:+ start:3722 stop:5536 length:1815 start_codon:yes stop_codon:yes gene_type:complete